MVMAQILQQLMEKNHMLTMLHKNQVVFGLLFINSNINYTVELPHKNICWQTNGSQEIP